MNARDDARPAHVYPAGPPTIPHRKNAVEWLLWLVLRPIDFFIKWVAHGRR
jgi:hypothetical protein